MKRERESIKPAENKPGTSMCGAAPRINVNRMVNGLGRYFFSTCTKLVTTLFASPNTIMVFFS
jgi:hypothetical protein